MADNELALASELIPPEERFGGKWWILPPYLRDNIKVVFDEGVRLGSTPEEVESNWTKLMKNAVRGEEEKKPYFQFDAGGTVDMPFREPEFVGKGFQKVAPQEARKAEDLARRVTSRQSVFDVQPKPIDSRERIALEDEQARFKSDIENITDRIYGEGYKSVAEELDKRGIYGKPGKEILKDSLRGTIERLPLDTAVKALGAMITRVGSESEEGRFYIELLNEKKESVKGGGWDVTGIPGAKTALEGLNLLLEGGIAIPKAAGVVGQLAGGIPVRDVRVEMPSQTMASLAETEAGKLLASVTGTGLEFAAGWYPFLGATGKIAGMVSEADKAILASQTAKRLGKPTEEVLSILEEGGVLARKGDTKAAMQERFDSFMESAGTEKSGELFSAMQAMNEARAAQLPSQAFKAAGKVAGASVEMGKDIVGTGLKLGARFPFGGEARRIGLPDGSRLVNTVDEMDKIRSGLLESVAKNQAKEKLFGQLNSMLEAGEREGAIRIDVRKGGQRVVTALTPEGGDALELAGFFQDPSTKRWVFNGDFKKPLSITIKEMKARAVEKLRDTLRRHRTTLLTGFDPIENAEAFRDAVKVGALTMAEGAIQWGKWFRLMKEEFPEMSGNEALRIWVDSGSKFGGPFVAMSEKEILSAVKDKPSEGVKPSLKRAEKTPNEVRAENENLMKSYRQGVEAEDWPEFDREQRLIFEETGGRGDYRERVDLAYAGFKEKTRARYESMKEKIRANWIPPRAVESGSPQDYFFRRTEKVHKDYEAAQDRLHAEMQKRNDSAFKAFRDGTLSWDAFRNTEAASVRAYDKARALAARKMDAGIQAARDWRIRAMETYPKTRKVGDRPWEEAGEMEYEGMPKKPGKVEEMREKFRESLDEKKSPAPEVDVNRPEAMVRIRGVEFPKSALNQDEFSKFVKQAMNDPEKLPELELEIKERMKSEGKWPKEVVEKGKPGRFKGEMPEAMKKEEQVFGIGEKVYKVKFEDDIDRAAFMAYRLGRKSPAAQAYLRWVGEKTGMEEGRIVQHGKKVESQLAKMAKRVPGEELVFVRTPDRTLGRLETNPEKAVPVEEPPVKAPVQMSPEEAAKWEKTLQRASERVEARKKSVEAPVEAPGGRPAAPAAVSKAPAPVEATVRPEGPPKPSGEMAEMAENIRRAEAAAEPTVAPGGGEAPPLPPKAPPVPEGTPAPKPKWFSETAEKTAKDGMEKAPEIYKVALELANFPKAWLTSFDLSATFRQAFDLTLSHPGLALKGFKHQLKAFIDDDYAAAWEEFFHAGGPNLDNGWDLGMLKEEAGLQLPHIYGTLVEGEEGFLSNWGHNFLPTRASERAYVTYLNFMRDSVFHVGVMDLKDAGHFPWNDIKPFKRLAALLNTATGRGWVPFKQSEGMAALSNFMFWSPKFMTSRYEYWGRLLDASVRGPSPLRKMAARQLLAKLTWWGTMGAIFNSGAKREGWDAHFDYHPTSSTFLRVRIGKTTLDVAGGYGPALRVFMQTAMGEKLKPESGEIRKLPGIMRVEPAYTGLFLNKLAPVPSSIASVLKGEMIATRQPVNAKNIALGLTVPIVSQGIIQVGEEHGALGKAILATFPDIIGIGTTVRQMEFGEGEGGPWPDIPLFGNEPLTPAQKEWVERLKKKRKPVKRNRIALPR